MVPDNMLTRLTVGDVVRMTKEPRNSSWLACRIHQGTVGVVCSESRNSETGEVYMWWVKFFGVDKCPFDERGWPVFLVNLGELVERLEVLPDEGR